MTENISEQAKDQAIIAAATLAGPNATDADVLTQLRRIAGFLAAGSPLRYEFEAAEKAASDIEKTKTFLSTITGVDREVTSNRGIIFSTGLPSERNKDGRELVRSARLEDQAARDLMNKAKTLIGHKVRYTVDVILLPSGDKMRQVRHIEDQGVDNEYEASLERFQPKKDLVKDKEKRLVSLGAKAPVKA